ncbi:MAG: ferritin-like domain-containing protein [Planctomycetota bacterium]
MNQELQEALGRARKMEIDGADFYTELAKKCAVLSGKRMFESFAADERRHLKVVSDVAEGLGVDMESQPMPRDEIRTIFTEAKENVGDYLEASPDEQEAIRIAMGMETDSYKLYSQAAEDATDDLTRQLMERLAREENQHYEMLENTLEYLNSNEEWFLWSEWALIVGDQTSLGAE